MARREAVNTFTDGMISDLNPINTPNTVLTDCLNGTLITYDGNEYTLQNDKGNFPLKDCKLQENYIPVGVREYGDILYIVSYNPITKHVQIGSYPSPETIFDEFDINGLIPDNNLNYDNVNSIWDRIINSIKYSELTEDLENLKLFYGPIPENYKINPGDKYKLELTGLPNSANGLDLGTFEGFEFYIFDENRKPYDITKNIEINTQEHTYTSWKVPGYMATKLRFAQIDDFKVNIRKVIVPTYTITGQSALKELSLNFQYFISDYLYNNHVVKTIGSLKLLIEIRRNGSALPSIVSENSNNSPIQIVDLKNGTYCYYIDWTLPNTDDYKCDSDDKLELVVTPFVELNQKIVYYDKFKRTLTFDLAQKGDVNDFDIGEGIWRYTVDDKLILYFDTSGVQETSVFAQDVELQYKITRISNNTDIGDWRSIYDWNVVGDTILKIDFDPWTGVFDTTKFYAEDYYQISFRFIDPESNGLLRQDLITKSLLATELLNGSSSKHYDKVYFDEWINNYPDHIKNKHISVAAEIDPNSVITDEDAKYDNNYTTWYYNSELNKYPTYINSTLINSENGIPDFNISSELKFETNITYNSDIEVLKGPLWTNLNSILNYTNTKSALINTTTGKIQQSDVNILDSRINSLKKTLNYKLIQQGGPGKIVAIEEGPVKKSGPTDIIITANGIYEDDISPNGKPEPDLEVTINDGSQKDIYINKTTSFNNSTVSKLLNKLNTNDVLFCKLDIPSQTLGDDSRPSENHNVLKFKIGEGLSDGFTYASATGDTTSSTYYAVFKYPGETASSGGRRTEQSKLLFVRVGNLTTSGDTVTSTFSDSGSAHTLFNNWVSRIKHYKGLGYSVIGNFYKAEQATPSTKIPTISIETYPELTFDSWTFNNHNMFNSLDRSSISSIDNFFKLSSTEKEILLLSGIKLDKNVVELQYDGNTDTIDAVLAQVQQKINDRNSLVEQNIVSWREDTFVQAHSDEDSEYLDEFSYETTSLNSNDVPLLAMLNKTYNCSTPVMFVIRDYYWISGYGHNTSAEYIQQNYMGVSDSEVAIT